jgi:hypothetical protein
MRPVDKRLAPPGFAEMIYVEFPAKVLPPELSAQSGPEH